MKEKEYVAVRDVILDSLHTTDDVELQAALWQLLDDHTQLEQRRVIATSYLLRAEEV